jgi:ubiquinone/menaquinone biosynthesis C-methylase UbiE
MILKKGDCNLSSNDDFQDILVCPECHAKLRFNDRACICTNCDTSYPVHNDIFLFAFKGSPVANDNFNSNTSSCKMETLSQKQGVDIRKSLRKMYWKMQNKIVPNLLTSLSEYEDILRVHLNSNNNWLDIGCGHHILPEWRLPEEKTIVEKCNMVVGIDYDLHSLQKHRTIKHRVQGNITKLAFKNNSFHLATANMVLEHLDNPYILFKEINRILVPGGYFIFHTPNTQGYKTKLAKCVPELIKDKLVYLLEGRKEEDIFKTFYKANSIFDVRELAKSSSFQVIDIRMGLSVAEFMYMLPLAFFELLWIRMLMRNKYNKIRPNIIAILQKGVRD